ncbi:MAG: hypothetical protein JOZ62_10700 [Acidobacteriaceae bacterium]|nr:hypothetical protein [Acidobacteriaceae bacterium]
MEFLPAKPSYRAWFERALKSRTGKILNSRFILFAHYFGVVQESITLSVNSSPDAETPNGFDFEVKLQMLDGAREEFPATIRRATTGFFQLRCPVRLADGRKLNLIYLDRSVEAEVMYCQKQDFGRYHVGIRMMESKGTIRRELRLPVDVSGMLFVPGRKPIPARIVDMSQSGLGMLIGSAVRSGISASVDLDAGMGFGEIRYCNQESNGVYRAGFWLEEFICRGISPTRESPERNRATPLRASVISSILKAMKGSR